MKDLTIENDVIDLEVQIDSNEEIEVEIDDTTTIEVGMEEDTNTIDASLEEEPEITVQMDSEAHEISSTKHNELQNRNLPDQHSIESITGLRTELEELKNRKVVNSYNDLVDKPQINGVELVGNKTHQQIGIAPIDDIEIEAILDWDTN